MVHREKRNTEEEVFAPGRIYAYPDSSFLENEDFAHLWDNSNSPFWRAVNTLSQGLLVRPVEGNLTIPLFCYIYESGENEGECINGTLQPLCSIFDVPASFYSTSIHHLSNIKFHSSYNCIIPLDIISSYSVLLIHSGRIKCWVLSMVQKILPLLKVQCLVTSQEKHLKWKGKKHQYIVNKRQSKICNWINTTLLHHI